MQQKHGAPIGVRASKQKGARFRAPSLYDYTFATEHGYLFFFVAKLQQDAVSVFSQERRRQMRYLAYAGAAEIDG